MLQTNMLTLALSLLLPITACDLEQLPTFDRAAQSSDADARPHHGPPGPPPPVLLLELAVDIGGLDDDAGMTEALTAMETTHAGVRTAHDDLRQALAVAVAAGSITIDGVSTELRAITTAARGEARSLTHALDEAHARLDAELRAEVVEALPEPPAPPTEGDRPPPPEGASGERPGGPLGELVEALELDEDQQQALRDALGEPTMRPEPPPPLDLAAFADDGFDAASLGLDDLHASRLTEEATRLVELLTALVPLLDDDQRATLVERLAEPPAAPTRSARG